jgi:Holliday junction resolvase RusA-like endonuclease
LKLKKKDVANYTKNAEDVVFSFLGADDSSIIKSIIEKGIIEEGQSVALQCDIELYAMEPLSMIRFNDVRNDFQKS